MRGYLFPYLLFILLSSPRSPLHMGIVDSQSSTCWGLSSVPLWHSLTYRIFWWNLFWSADRTNWNRNLGLEKLWASFISYTLCHIYWQYPLGFSASILNQLRTPTHTEQPWPGKTSMSWIGWEWKDGRCHRQEGQIYLPFFLF